MIAVLAAVLAPAVRIMHVLLRTEREGARALAAGVTAVRLSRTFRQDVHAALDVELSFPEPGRAPRLTLVQPQGRVILYEPQQDVVVRIVRELPHDEEPGHGGARDGMETREPFRLPGSTEFELSADPPLVTLVHRRRGPEWVSPEKVSGTLRKVPDTFSGPAFSGPHGVDLAVDAVPGRDHRFSR